MSWTDWREFHDRELELKNEKHMNVCDLFGTWKTVRDNLIVPTNVYLIDNGKCLEVAGNKVTAYEDGMEVATITRGVPIKSLAEAREVYWAIVELEGRFGP